MSDISDGPDWWTASDGKRYPPELHPSVRADHRQGPHDEKGEVTAAGTRQFPDLFQKALQGSHLADNVTVKYDGEDERNGAGPSSGPQSSSPSGSVHTMSPGSRTPVAAGPAGVSFGAPLPAKRKWRKGR